MKPDRSCKLAAAYREGQRAAWHRRGHRPRPVVVVKPLDRKVRVADLVASSHRRIILRDVMASSLTGARG